MNATLLDPKTSVKVVGSSGQISLGKEYAGRRVLVEEREPGVWLIRTARIIPENELWLHTSEAQGDLRDAIAWAETHPAAESDLDTLVTELEHEEQKQHRRKARSK